MALFTADGTLFLLRWLHFLAGITWIGLLYYFNFVQAPFFAKADPSVRSGMLAGGAVELALWWFRWGAMVTFVTGWLYILHVTFAQYGGVREIAGTAYGWKIFFGAMLGSLMWFNVWFVIWPAQRVVIRSAQEVAARRSAMPDAAARTARSGLASRTNTLLSIPMLFFMGAASHLPLQGPTSARQKIGALALLLVVMAVVELNAIVGAATPDRASTTKKMITNPRTGLSLTLWAGFLVTAILYVGLARLFR